MLIKNCVVLVDEIDQRVTELGMTHDAIARAAISRLRPVILAAGTTIFGTHHSSLTPSLWKWPRLHHGRACVVDAPHHVCHPTFVPAYQTSTQRLSRLGRFCWGLLGAPAFVLALEYSTPKPAALRADTET